MNTMPEFFNPTKVLLGVFLISAISLIMAFIAQYVYDLQPCILCIYQRIPFAVTLVVSLIALNGRSLQIQGKALLLCAGAFFINTLLAVYHSGIERKWWPSHLEGCTVPDLGDDPQAVLEAVLNAPSVRCDEIPWADPVLGLSMANYNAILCDLLCIICILAYIQTRRP